MPLTKVREVVSNIARIRDGSSNVEVLSPGGDIDIDVGGINAVSISPTVVEIDSGVNLEFDEAFARRIELSDGTVTGELDADTSSMQIGTSSAHPVTIKANAIDALTADVAGRVTLGVQGNSANHLVNKAYVDALVSVTEAGQANTLNATNGTQTIQGSTGDLIIKWGSLTTSGDGVVTFTTAFPNAFFSAVCTPTQNIDGNSDGWFRIHSASTTGFTISPANRPGSETFYWIAIGF